jgi:hypothetical protein
LFRSAGLDLNFAGGVFSLNNTRTDSPANIPGWAFSRTDTNGIATALDLAGNVIQFATGVPRITNRGILVEEARTNLFPRSTEFDNAIWLKTGVTVTANQIAAPDASTTADAFTEDMGLSTHRVLYGSSSVTSGTSYTLSAFVKASGRTWCALNFATGFTNERASFNLANGTLGTVTGGTATITALANSWYRVTLTATCILTTAAGATYLEWASADNTVIYTGSGALAGYWWGAQLEAGAFATSPIITTGAAGTRGADAGRITQSPTASGTIIATVRIPTDKNNRRVVGTNGASAVTPLAYSTAGIETYNGSSTLGKTVSMTAGALVTVGVTWESGRRSVTGAGLTVATDANAIGSFTEMWFGQDDSLAAGNALNESIVRVQVLPYAVTDAQLQSLTAP